ncbi:hypothetical protein MKW98_001660 [Papaver atlanticum]|uniref:BHLH domain-containing protein n=1 Tax=Papaver atlanticum TaxID=357466 RepID=A0AAD4X8Q8_9MAGN|nr:hypothetical protein MKW98_001660 [Papaver atlanticum]
MEKFQGPTSNHHCFGGNLDVDEGVSQQCHGNTSFNFSYGAPYFNLEEESFTIQEEQQQQQQEEFNTNQQSSLSLSVPVISLEDKMPFLEMLKSVDSPYYSDPSPAPLNPHFKMLLTLQQQQDTQIPYFSGSSSSEQSSMDYYYSHQMEAPQPVAFQPQSCATATQAENQAHSSVKSEDNKEKEEQEHMEQLEQGHAQDFYLSLHLESANNENNKTDDGELGGEPPNYSSPESLNCKQTVSSPTTTCCLAETESISPHDMPPSKTKPASKQALPAARLVTSSTAATTSGGGGHEREKKKRKRTRPNKNREEVESQRMTHIAVERNRRRQMNDHLNALRSLMPPSFVQRGDQASIIGGAIDFVKELEQLLHSLEAKKRTRTSSEDEDDNEKVGIEGRRNRNCGNHSSLAPFLGFFSAPQYTSYSSSPFLKNDAEEEDEKEEEEVINEDELRMLTSNNIKRSCRNEHEYYSLSLLSPSPWLGVDIEAVVVQTHVNLKILGPRKSGQLVRVIAALEQDLRLAILHLNVTSFEQSVLYSFNLKIEDDCKLGGSADEIATAVYQIFSSTNNQLHLIS